MSLDHIEVVVQVLAVGLYGVSTLILLPIELYYAVRFCWHRSAHIVAKRRPGMSILGMLFATTFYLLVTAYSFWSWLDSHEVFGSTEQMAYLYPIAMASWYIYIARLWLLFYSIKFNMETIKGKWQTIIDPDNSTKRQWFHSHRKLLGTAKGASIGIVLYCSMVLVLIVLLRTLTDDDIEEDVMLSTGLILYCLLQSILFVLPFLLILFVLCSIPRHYDSFAISREVSWTAVCYAVVLVTATLLNVWVLRYHQTVTKELLSAVELVMLILWRIAFFGVAMIQVPICSVSRFLRGSQSVFKSS